MLQQFVFHVNEVQKAAWIAVLCQGVIVKYVSHFVNENFSPSSMWILCGESDGMEIRIAIDEYYKHDHKKYDHEPKRTR